MKNQGTIYKIENLIDGKVYIGQTVRKPKYRINRHLTTLREGVHPNAHLQRAYDKYGEESFNVTVVEKVPQSQLDERERYWISFYRESKGAYNFESGGNKLKKHSPESIKRMSIKNKENMNKPSVRKKLRKRWELWEGQGNPNARKVICINTNETFNTITEAAKKFNLSVSQISEVCNGIYKSAGFFTNGVPLQFAYYEEGKEYKLQDITGLKKPRKVILTNTGETFCSVREAAKKYNLSQGSISNCCKGEIRSAGKLPNGEYSVWVYEEDYDSSKNYFFHRNKGKNNPNSTKVICLNTKKVFDTIKEAGEEYGIKSYSHISSVCTGKRKHCGMLSNGEKLKWMYYEDYQALTK